MSEHPDRRSRRDASITAQADGIQYRGADDGGAVEPPDRRRMNTRWWLASAGALSVLVVGMFAIGLQLQIVVPLIGIVLTCLLYGAMVVVALRAGSGPGRLRMLAALMIGIALVLVVFGGIFYFIEASTFVFPFRSH